jgi:CubicO group peptidase (beta-lactamase class C family)
MGTAIPPLSAISSLDVKFLHVAGLAFALACLSAVACAQDPKGAGFSADRLARIAPWYQSQINSGAFTGAVIAVERQGKLAYLQAIGTQDRAASVSLKPDAIFWIASMTKPVTSVAAMMLVDEGKLDLSAPVAQYLPELRDMKVGIDDVEPGTGKHSLRFEPLKRPMLVIDLLQHTSGLTYPEEGTSVIHQIYGLADFRRDHPLSDFVKSLSWMPLVHQPGEVWEYSWGVDVLARVIEVASGQSFDQFLQARIFGPLGMVDTGFSVAKEKLSRLVDPPPGLERMRTWDVTKPAVLFSGGGGLVSTAPDYLRFCRMLLNGGELEGVRILSAQSVKRMTTDALPPGIRFAGVTGQFVGPAVGTSWGLGFAIRTNPDYAILPGAVGSFNWSGLWGTYFWIDPVEKLIAIQMIQTQPTSNSGRFRNGLRHLTYAALTVPDHDLPSVAIEPTARDDALSAYAGKYDFGQSLSAHDRQAPLPAFAGVGMQVDLIDGSFVVRSVFDGLPASQAGLLAGDVITHVDDAPLKGLSIDHAIDKVRGRVGTEVQLRIVRGSQREPTDFIITRQLIHPPGARIEVRTADGGLTVAAVGPWSVLDFEIGKPVAVRRASGIEFRVEGGDDTRLAFVKDREGKVIQVLLNPGPWQIEGRRVN